jgi:hypothetical protein
MKECPNCKKVFPDDLFYCLYDGVALADTRSSVSHDAPTEVVEWNAEPSVPTAVIPIRITDQTPAGRSKLPYVIIGALLLICAGLGGALAITYLSRTSEDKGNDKGKTIAGSPTPAPANSSTPAAANSATPAKSATPMTVQLDPTGKWRGQWSTDSGTLFDIELTLSKAGGDNVEGSLLWTMRKTARPDKASKIGLTATEFVRGAFDPESHTVKLAGYGKDDPDEVLVMTDQYRLNISADGRTLNGFARNGGKWNGHIKLSR